MLKIRLQGLPSVVRNGVRELEKVYNVLSVSSEYKNRNSKYVRVYVEVEVK